jgi:2-dehydropantoate 2-reductase
MFRIVIVGHGAVGLSLVSFLIGSSKEQLSLTFYSPGKKASPIKPFQVQTNDSLITIGTQYFGTEESLRECDVLILCMKVTDLSSLSSKSFKLLSKKAIVVTLFNGILFTPWSTLSPTVLVKANIYISCFKQQNFIVNFTEKPRIIINRDKLTTEHFIVLHTFSRLLEKQNIRVDYSDNFRWEAWRKLIVTSAINGACILFDCLPDEIFSNYGKLSVLSRLIQEGCHAAQLDGIEFNDPARQAIMNDIRKMPAECPPSMYFDYVQNKRTEVDYLNGTIVELMHRHGQAAHLHTSVLEKVKRFSSHINKSINRS